MSIRLPAFSSFFTHIYKQFMFNWSSFSESLQVRPCATKEKLWKLDNTGGCIDMHTASTEALQHASLAIVRP